MRLEGNLSQAGAAAEAARRAAAPDATKRYRGAKAGTACTAGTDRATAGYGDDPAPCTTQG